MLDLDIELKDVNAEDIGDVLGQLEKSFGITFPEEAFRDVKTFGDICAVVEAHISYGHQDSCTTQQAFYKVRDAIASTFPALSTEITPETRLESFFPLKTRRTDVKRFTGILNVKTDMLGWKGWVAVTIVLGFWGSVIAFFFDWRIAVSGLVFFYLAIKAADRFSKELMVDTVGELAQMLTRENYIAVRRQAGTINRKEINEVIVDAFSTRLSIDRERLTKDASLGLK